MCKAFEDMIAEGKAEGMAEGMAKGMAKGIAEGKVEERQSSIQKLILVLREIGTEENIILNKLILHYQLSEEEALAAMNPI